MKAKRLWPLSDEQLRSGRYGCRLRGPLPAEVTAPAPEPVTVGVDLARGPDVEVGPRGCLVEPGPGWLGRPEFQAGKTRDAARALYQFSAELGRSIYPEFAWMDTSAGDAVAGWVMFADLDRDVWHLPTRLHEGDRVEVLCGVAGIPDGWRSALEADDCRCATCQRLAEVRGDPRV